MVLSRDHENRFFGSLESRISNNRKHYPSRRDLEPNFLRSLKSRRFGSENAEIDGSLSRVNVTLQ